MTQYSQTKIRRKLIERMESKNPYSVAAIRNALRAAQDMSLYEDLDTRVAPSKQPPEQAKIDTAIARLRERIGVNIFRSEHFGRLEEVAFVQLIINIDNQRDVDWDHVAYIIENFDPRAVQVVNAIKLEDGRYSVPEGQHTSVALYILWLAGIIDSDFKVMCKVIDEMSVVPGNKLRGEAFGNFLFRLINYKGRKAVAPYYMHKSRVSGVRNYGSVLAEDLHAEKIESVVENNGMYTAPAIEARGRGAKEGMVTYINGLNKIAGLETDSFDDSIMDLDFALSLHNEYFSAEKGVDGGFILALGRYAALARKEKVIITRDWREDLMSFFKETYASPSKFHSTCKSRLKNFNREYNLPDSWSDNCLLSILIIDFKTWCDANSKPYPLLPDQNLNKYEAI